MNVECRELVESESGGSDGDVEGGKTDKKKKNRKKKNKKKKQPSEAATSEAPRVAASSAPPADDATTFRQANAEAELRAARVLRERYSAQPVGGEVGGHAPPSADPLSARLLADRRPDGKVGDASLRLPPPPLERLAVEKNVVLGVMVERWPAAHPHKRHMFTTACEALTYLQSELGADLTHAYLASQRFDRVPGGMLLNPARMRAPSDHSWWTLLLLESARAPPKQYEFKHLFSEQTTRDPYCVISFDVSSPRDQLRRLGWFGYEYSKAHFQQGDQGEAGVRSAPEGEPERRAMLNVCRATAAKYDEAGKHFESLHALQEALSLAHSLRRRRDGADLSMVADLVAAQGRSLDRLGRRTEYFRIRSRLEPALQALVPSVWQDLAGPSAASQTSY